MIRVTGSRTGRVGVTLMVLAVAGLAGASFTALASPAYNVFVNAEFEACAPLPDIQPVPSFLIPPSLQGRSSCEPWLLRTPGGTSGTQMQSRESILYASGFGNTNSARVTYHAADGNVLFGQYTPLPGEIGVAAWRAIQQVTFDLRVSGDAELSFRADGIARDGQRVTVTADEGVVSITGDNEWRRETFTLSGLVEPDGRRVPFTGVWFEIHPGTTTGAFIDIDNVYATNLYLEPYPNPRD